MEHLISIMLSLLLLLVPQVVSASQFEFLLNKYREVNQVSELVQSDYMNQWAVERACWVDENREDVLSHYKITGHHLGFRDFKKISGENIAFDYEDELNILRAWIQSPSHNDNLLADRYSLYGLGRCGDTTIIMFD